MTDQNDGTTSQEQETLGEGGIRALQAERNARRDAEKALRKAEERIAGFERADIVREVAAAKGLSPAMAARLQGSTKEELEADADAFVELIKPEQAGGVRPPGLPKERLSGGGDPTVDATIDSAGPMADRILG
jgi:hypothetical protein